MPIRNELFCLVGRAQSRALVLECVETLDEAAPDCVVQGASRNVETQGKSSEEKTLRLGQTEVAVVLDFDDEAHSMINVLA